MNQEQVTVRDVLEWFRQRNPRKGRSMLADIERTRLRALFVERFGDQRCKECRPFLLMDFIASQPGVRSNWTKKRWNTCIQQPFNYAAKMGLIERNPFQGVTYGEGVEGRDWTQAEFLSMMRATTPDFRRVLVCIRFSGMRPGEVRELLWEYIRPDLNAIVIDAEKTKMKRTRRIPLNPVLVKLLAWCARRNPRGSSHVLLNSHRQPWTIGAFVKRICRLRDGANLAPDVRLHGMRHFFATTAILNGIEIATLAQLLGHKNISTTQRYVHLANKTDHLADAMTQAIGGAHQPDEQGASALCIDNIRRRLVVEGKAVAS